MDAQTTLGRDDGSAIDFHGRTWRWERLARRQARRRRWTLFGIGLLLAFSVALLGLKDGLTSGLQDSEAYRQAHADIAAHPEVAAQFGTPLSAAAPSGSIQATGPDGAADLQFGIAGPKGNGTAFVEARRRLGRWELEHLVVENDNGARIQLR